MVGSLTQAQMQIPCQRPSFENLGTRRILYSAIWTRPAVR